jgi:hypothetical protein
MHTDGPWACTPLEAGEYHVFDITSSEGHIASIVGWQDHGAVCATTEENARLIAAAPRMLLALEALCAWANLMGGWEASCWQEAEQALKEAGGTRSPPNDP